MYTSVHAHSSVKIWHKLVNKMLNWVRLTDRQAEARASCIRHLLFSKVLKDNMLIF